VCTRCTHHSSLIACAHDSLAHTWQTCMSFCHLSFRCTCKQGGQAAGWLAQQDAYFGKGTEHALLALEATAKLGQGVQEVAPTTLLLKVLAGHSLHSLEPALAL
jgi:hypothetical protein